MARILRGVTITPEANQVLKDHPGWNASAMLEVAIWKAYDDERQKLGEPNHAQEIQQAAQAAAKAKREELEAQTKQAKEKTKQEAERKQKLEATYQKLFKQLLGQWRKATQAKGEKSQEAFALAYEISKLRKEAQSNGVST